MGGATDPGLHRLHRTAPSYPSALRHYLRNRAPAVVTARGNLAILANQMLALFCSVRCPGDLILKTYDLARSLRDAGVTVIGGFHSPMEKECLTLLLRGKQPVAVCLARALDSIRLPGAWRTPLVDGASFCSRHSAGSTAESSRSWPPSVTSLWLRSPMKSSLHTRNGTLVALGARPVQSHSALGKERP